MPTVATLVSVLETVVGNVTGMFVTSDPRMAALNVGGGIQINGRQFLCLSSSTQSMLIIAGIAMTQGDQVSINFWSLGDVIDSIELVPAKSEWKPK
jgi:hypothetical protein